MSRNHSYQFLTKILLNYLYTTISLIKYFLKKKKKKLIE